MGIMTMRANIVARYVNILILAYFFRGGPMPGFREGLIILSLCTLSVNVLVHAYVSVTKNYRMAGYMLLGLDVATILPAIYFTGMVASPFIVLLPMSLFSTFFINRDAKVTVAFGLLAALGFVALATLWWRNAPNATVWNPRVFPGFTLFAFILQTISLLVATYQASFLPNPMLVELQRQEAILANQANAAELGVSLAMVVHELRNPLTSIGGRLELATENLRQGLEASPAAALRSVELATEDLKRMGRMLEDVLAYGRNRQGVTRTEPVDVREAVVRAVDFIRLKHGSHKARCTVGGVTGKLIVAGDRDALYQVVVNLLDNAVTSEAEGRRLKIGVTLSTVVGHHLMEIRDNGCGMSPELADRIFMPFVTSRPQGTGLGMPIVKRIVTDHGGTIDLESSVGVGTTVRLRLPELAPAMLSAPAEPVSRRVMTEPEPE